MNEAQAEGWADHTWCCVCDKTVCVEDPGPEAKQVGRGDWVCSDDCWDEFQDQCDLARLMDHEDLIDGVGFADPGGRSSLRAETPENPRNLPCPNCGRKNVLTPLDRKRGYQCDACADQLERGLVL